MTLDKNAGDHIIADREDRIGQIRQNLEKGVWTKDFKHRSKGEKLRTSLASEKNRKAILSFEREWDHIGKTPMTRLNYMSVLHTFAEYIGSKTFGSITKDDMMSYFDRMRAHGAKGKGVSDTTLNGAKAVIKIFYKWLNGGEEYPECVRWYKARQSNGHITSEDILSPDEIKKLIASSRSFRNKAVIAVLYESGCRISEFLGMRIRDIQFDDNGARIRVSGKTGERVVRLVNSMPYLKEWLKVHPYKENPESYLWVIENDGSDGRGKHTSMLGAPLKENGVNSMMKRLGRKCNISKTLRPHIFRHSRITELATKLSGTVLNNYVGWKTSSRMAETYVHHNRTEIDNSVLKNVYNITNLDKVQETAERLLPQMCYNCGEKNMAEVDYCTKCNMPLDEKAFRNKVQRNDLIVQKLSASPEIMQQLIQKEVRKAIDELLKMRAR